MTADQFADVTTETEADAALAAFDDRYPNRVRFLKIAHGSVYSYPEGTICVQKCDGMILGRGDSKTEAWNDFANLQRIIRK